MRVICAFENTMLFAHPGVAGWSGCGHGENEEPLLESESRPSTEVRRIVSSARREDARRKSAEACSYLLRQNSASCSPGVFGGLMSPATTRAVAALATAAAAEEVLRGGMSKARTGSPSSRLLRPEPARAVVEAVVMMTVFGELLISPLSCRLLLLFGRRESARLTGDGAAGESAGVAGGRSGTWCGSEGASAVEGMREPRRSWLVVLPPLTAPMPLVLPMLLSRVVLPDRETVDAEEATEDDVFAVVVVMVLDVNVDDCTVVLLPLTSVLLIAASVCAEVRSCAATSRACGVIGELVAAPFAIAAGAKAAAAAADGLVLVTASVWVLGGDAPCGRSGLERLAVSTEGLGNTRYGSPATKAALLVSLVALLPGLLLLLSLLKYA